MTKPTIGQARWLALFLALFFALTSVGQYLFVRHQTRAMVRRQLDDRAEEFKQAVVYRNGSIDLKTYNQAIIDFADYFTVLESGAVLDIGGSQELIPDLIPEVDCPILSQAAFSRPVDTTYTIPGVTPERWWIYARKLDRGVAVMGISGLDGVQFPERELERNITAFGATVDSAQHVNARKLDAAISAWAVITESGQLVAGYGRIPLQIKNPVAMGRIAAQGEQEKRISGKTYLVLYSPLRGASRDKLVATIVIPQDITIELQALRSQVKFNATIGGSSFLLFLILSVLYSSKHENEKRELKEAFQHYFSPQILEAIIREPGLLTLGGQRREVTILFSDIRSFTSLSEKIPPQQLSRILQEYFTTMTDEVLATDGVVDKYIGDAIMAFWGAPIEQPDQANRAVRTAVAMIQRLKKLHEQWRAEGYPTFDIGIGINLGVATVGNMGSSKRFDYTVIGDAVNAASRIEGLNKNFESHILISDSTKQQLTIAVRTRDRGEVQLRGKEKPTRVFEVEVG